MTVKQLTCEERIAVEMADREEYAASLFRAADDQATAEDLTSLDIDRETDIVPEIGLERLDEWPLGIDTYRVMRIELSTGGPGDWLEVKLDDENQDGQHVERVDYHFNDWFDHAERPVAEDSALWRIAEYFAESV